MSWLLDPFSDPLLRRAFGEVVLLGLAGGAMGCWVVLSGLGYAAESLAHALLPGLVLAALLGIPLLLGGLAGILVAAVAIALAGRLPEIGRDTATAVVITGLFGLGVLLALSPEVPARLQELLFGDVLATSAHDLVVSAALVVVVLAVLAVAHPRLAAVGFDRMSARALGVRVGAVDVVLLALLAVVVLVATKGLGNLLVVSVLVAPAVAAQRVTRRLGPMLAVSAGVAVLGGVVGLQVSYHADTAAGASIALSLVALAAVAAAGSSLARRAYA